MLHSIFYNLKSAISKAGTAVITLIVTTLIFLLIILLATIKPAVATITETELAPGQNYCRSEQVLKDEAGHKWQVMLFTQVNSEEVSSLNLRLSGLSSSSHLQYRKPLTIIASDNRYQAPDIFLGKSPLPSIGQYDLKDILLEIPESDLVLEIPLQKRKSAHLQIPKTVVKEWLELAAKMPSADHKIPSSLELAC